MGEFETTAFPTQTGATLSLRHMSARSAERGVVQINHGLAEHSARYRRFAYALADAGFHVYAQDHRGHGAAKAPGAPLGRFAANDGVALVLADIEALHQHIARSHPGLPLIIFGHSMGGLVTLNAVLRRSDHLAGAAVWNANFSAGTLGRLAQAILAWERFRLGGDVPSRILPRLTFQAWGKAIPQARTPFDWLSRDPDEVDAYIADPLCGWDPSVSMWQDIFGMIFVGANDRNFAGVRHDLPFHLTGGSADPSTDNGRAVESLAARMERMGFSNLQTRVWPENRHESLKDLDRDAVTADFVEWARRVAATA